MKAGKAEPGIRLWLLGKGRRHDSNSPSNGPTAGFLCGQIGGHYVPKLGLNCGSGNESGCSNATAPTAGTRCALKLASMPSNG